MSPREFSSAPGTLQLFARAGAALIPGASKLPFVAGGGGEVPESELLMNDIEVDRRRLAAYNRVCGFSLRGELPPTYPHVVAFALHLVLMTDGRFPFPPVGLVHVSNSITQHRPVLASEVLSVRVRAGKLKEHSRGSRFALLTEARVRGELVWEEESVHLRRAGGSDGSQKVKPAPGVEGRLPGVAQWRVPGDMGRRYARVSADRNPIHMHAVTARLFGFRAAIAHGMWTKARCLAALEGRLPEAFTVAVEFRKPILLPASVTFAQAGGARRPGGAREAGGVRFAVRDAREGTPHLDGRIDPPLSWY